MNRLKRSYAAKTLAFLLSLVLLTAACATVTAGVYAYRQNLIGADKDAFMQKIFSFAAEYTANRARRYFDYAQASGLTDRDTDYFSNEAELLRSSFTRERCNAAFVIRDENGEEVLKNYELPEYAYEFERLFHVYEEEGPVDYTAAQTEDEMIPEETETAAPETQPAEPETETLPPEEPQTAPAAPAASPMALRPAEEPTSGEVETTMVRNPTDGEPGTEAPTPENRYGVYIGDEFTPDGERFRFIFPKGKMDETILSYCKQLFSVEEPYGYGDMGDGYVTYYQDQFSVSDNGVAYFNGRASLLQSYLQEDSSAYWEEHTTEEPYTEPAKTYTVTVRVAKDLTAKDEFYYAQKLGSAAYGYKKAMIPATALYLLAAAALWVFLFAAAGYKKSADGPVCGGLHRIPFDLATVLAGGLTVGGAAILIEIFDSTDMSLGALMTLVIPFVLSAAGLYFEGLAVRIRARALGKNLLVVYGWRLLKKLFAFGKKTARRLSDCMNIVWKTGVWYLVSFVAVIGVLLLTGSDGATVVAYVVFKLIEAPLIMLGILNFDLISAGTQKLAHGQTGAKIRSRLLFGEFRKQAEQLNAINDGIELAVRERMKSESMKTELITNVSHDLKTPLTSIVNYVDLLKKEPLDNPRAAEYVEVIDRQAQRLKKLTFDIVDASKAATGNVQMHPEKTDLGMLLGQVNGEYADKLAQRNLQIVTELPGTPLFIMADGRLLWRVLDNLMSNVCKYAMPGTRIYLSLTADGGYAKTTLRNISADALNISPEELTERFVRGDASRNTEGSGLGLSISKSLTENMGGEFAIHIDGDLFKVTLRFPLV